MVNFKVIYCRATNALATEICDHPSFSLLEILAIPLSTTLSLLGSSHDSIVIRNTLLVCPRCSIH